MAHPIATTCTKCRKPAIMARQEAMSWRKMKIGDLELDSTKLGWSYRIHCPYCGFSFNSHPKSSNSTKADS